MINNATTSAKKVGKSPNIHPFISTINSHRALGNALVKGLITVKPVVTEF